MPDCRFAALVWGEPEDDDVDSEEDKEEGEDVSEVEPRGADADIEVELTDVIVPPVTLPSAVEDEDANAPESA